MSDYSAFIGGDPNLNNSFPYPSATPNGIPINTAPTNNSAPTATVTGTTASQPLIGPNFLSQVSGALGSFLGAKAAATNTNYTTPPAPAKSMMGWIIGGIAAIALVITAVVLFGKKKKKTA